MSDIFPQKEATLPKNDCLQCPSASGPRGFNSRIYNTLRRWKKKCAAEYTGGALREVGLKAATAQVPALIAPSGWRIDGLRLDEIVEMAGRLSRLRACRRTRRRAT